MRTAKFMLVGVCFLVVSPLVWGQAASSPAATNQNPSAAATAGVLGYLDPHTGAFRPVPQAVEGSIPEAATVNPTTGTLTLTLTITLKTAGLTNISCSAEVSVFDGQTSASPRSFLEGAVVAATGTTTKTCKIVIPYSWSLTTASTDMMSTSYIVTGSTGAAGLPERTSSVSPFNTMKVPANTVSTALAANVTL